MPTKGKRHMPLKGPTNDDDAKVTRDNRANPGNSAGKSRDISKDVDRWSKVRGGRSGRC